MKQKVVLFKMSKYYLITCSVLLLFFNTAWADNLLEDGGFENTGSWAQWWGGNTVLSHTDPVEGDKCAAVWFQNDGIWQNVGWVSAGTYEYGGKLLAGANLVGKRVVIQVEMGDGAGTTSWTQQLNVTPGIAEDVWHSVSGKLFLTESYFVNINLMLVDENGSSGVGLFDDIYFRKVNGDIETGRYNYGARLEPENHVMHSGGQNIPDFWEYWWAMNSDERRPACYMSYCNLTSPFLPALQADLERYRTELSDGVYMPVQMGLWLPTNDNSELNKVANGEYDGDIQRFCNDLNKLGYPVYLRIGYECNGSHNGYDPAIFKAAFIRITNALRANKVEAATVFNVIQGPYLAYYPGDQYVDWMSINMFGSGNIKSPYTPAFLSDAETRGKPVLIGECGPVYVQTSNGQASWDGWFVPYFNLIKSWRGIKNFCYINADWGNNELGWGDCRLQPYPDVLGLYLNELDSSLILNGVNERAFRKEISKVNDTTAPGKVTGIAVDTVNSPVMITWQEPEDDTGINRYEIQRDDQLLGYCTANSYADQDVAAGKTYIYRITAIDSCGNRGIVSGPIKVVTSPTVEMIINGEFDLGHYPWSTTGNGNLQTGIDTNSLLSGKNSSKIFINSATGNFWELLYKQNLDTKAGFVYQLSFQAVADADTTIWVALQETHSPWSSFINKQINITTTPQTFTFSAAAPDNDNVDLNFMLGSSASRTIWLDAVSVKETSNDPDPQTCQDVLNEGVRLDSDFTCDCYVNIDDINLLIQYWLSDTFGKHGFIDLTEIALIAKSWLECNHPQDYNCISTW